MGNRQSRLWIVSDELWSLVEPLLPKPSPKKAMGRPRVPDRQALCGILFVLHTGIQWEYLPQELGFGWGLTCRRLLCIRPVIAKRGEPHGTGLGTFRYVVERTIAWLHGIRRLRIRWERRDDIHEAFLGLAVCLITHRHVQRLC
ncbi:transposase [Streptomyces sp. NPDC006617]|uniref:transposase n=1 Tax=Streptomyces sp. NPDC006617 TaxID=3155354 RepID=UPI0033BD4B95